MLSLLITMLPIYLIGNLHCIGMCGPLVMMLGRHKFRHMYFLGRTLSFSLAGMGAGEAGAVLNIILKQYHVSAATSFIFGGGIIILGIFQILGLQYPGYHWLSQQTSSLGKRLTILILKDQPLTTFLFGFFTIMLPCGQTVIVFSACALAGDALEGLINGFAFAVLTSPSLFLAMNAHNLLNKMKKYYQSILGCLAILVGILAVLRGLAEIDIVSHWILNPSSAPIYHIVIF
ncbi:MAG: sulfite exporter TauE/SafE [Chlamydiales bacterium]|jgi:sulfite exporter TauE/SafE